MTQQDEVAALCPRYVGAWSWVLSDITPTQQIPVKGKLGLYDVAVDPEKIKLTNQPDASSRRTT